METQMNRIMCVTDFSDYGNQTLSYGIALAKLFDARLYVCHVIDIAFSDIYGEALFNPVEQQQRITKYAHEKLAQLMERQTLEWEPLVVIGRPADEIASLTQEHDVDMVITASHGRSGLKRFVLGSVTERLMRTLQRPLLILRSSRDTPAFSTDQPLVFRKILVGTDFSPDSELAFQHALGVAQRFQAEVHLVHVMTASIHKYAWLESSGKSREEFYQELEAQYLDRLQKMFPDEVLKQCTAKPRMLIGQPYRELNRYAESNDIDLIVLGTRGTGIVETIFVGSTTDRVVRQAQCPVLSVCHKE